MKLYKGSFNYFGETINLWTHAHSKEQAFTYFIKKIAFRVDRTKLSISNYFLSGKDNYLIEEKKMVKHIPEYNTPQGQKCPACGELCKIVPLRNEFDYAGTHCTGGFSGTHYPEGWGDPVSDCCQVLITGEE